MISVLVSAAACAWHRRALETRPGECAFVVYNRTPHSLELRLARDLSTATIGAINQGELLNHSVPCIQGRVWVYGVPIPEFIGAPVKFSYVVGELDLESGARPSMELIWP